MKSVPDGIETPSYAFSGLPDKAPQRKTFLLDAEAVGCMREAGKLARTLLDYTASHIGVCMFIPPVKSQKGINAVQSL